MKTYLTLLLFVFLFFTGYAQHSAVKDSSKMKKINKNYCFDLDADDIYAGKELSDSIGVADKNNDYDFEKSYTEDETYKRRRHTEHVVEMILNIGLLFLWVFTH